MVALMVTGDVWSMKCTILFARIIQQFTRVYSSSSFIEYQFLCDADYRFAFDEFRSNQVSLLSLPYEYTSNMHYGAFAFSSNRQPTITALRVTYSALQILIS